jgi:hypothetical protein
MTKPSIDTTKAVEGFKRIGKAKKALGALALAAYKHPLTTGIRSRYASLAFGYPPNAPGYAARKGGHPPWFRTGATIRALSNNPPAKIGNNKGVRVGLNLRKQFAFAVPRVFTGPTGRGRLPLPRQQSILNALTRGSAIQKISSNAERRGADAGAALRDVFAPGRLRKLRRIPARPLLVWDSSWDSAMRRDIDRAVTQVMKEGGYLARS